MIRETSTDRPAPLDPLRVWHTIRALAVVQLLGLAAGVLLHWPAWARVGFSWAVSLSWLLVSRWIVRAIRRGAR